MYVAAPPVSPSRSIQLTPSLPLFTSAEPPRCIFLHRVRTFPEVPVKKRNLLHFLLTRPACGRAEVFECIAHWNWSFAATELRRQCMGDHGQ